MFRPAVSLLVALFSACGGAPAASSDPPATLASAIPRETVRQVPTLTPAAGIHAFPGAEGFGADATGGRGGRVLYVTTLAPSGPGSLQEALSAEGPRYILFKVSGLIDASPFIAQGNVTIAGQTSPGGIIVRGLSTGETPYCDTHCGAGVRGVDNVIIRHLRTRPGEPGDNGLIDGDALRIRHSRQVMIDHVSTGNAVDEAIEISYSNHVTVQDSILGETIGEHIQYGGMLVNYSNPAAGYSLDALTVVRTAWVRVHGRYPEISRESDAALGETLRVELANNLLWDQRFFITTGHRAGTNVRTIGDAFYQLNWVGNVGITRPTYSYGMIWFPNPTGRSTVFFDDNHLSAWSDRSDWQLNYCCDDFPEATPPARPSWARSARHDFPAISYLPSAQVRRYVAAHAGAFPRDPMDRRLMGYVADGIAPGGPRDANLADDAHRFDWSSPPSAPVDSDNDGMPDLWEMAHGLNPHEDDHREVWVGNPVSGGLIGYPNLEVYLHELAEQRMTEGVWGP